MINRDEICKSISSKMGPKKKGKGSKLSRMTEEERVRYLQHRAAIEEEARRRKQQLIATFMKNKLKREEAFTRLNQAKINQQWRQILRKIKTKELKQDLEALWQSFEHVTDRKTQIIKSLLKDLNESEEQYAKILQSHTGTTDDLLALHEERLSELHSAYDNDRRTLLRQTAKMNTKIKVAAATDEEYICTLLYGLEKSMEEFTISGEVKHMAKMDDFRNDMLCDCEQLQWEKESAMEKMWKKFQAVFKDYSIATESKRSHYNRLKFRDFESSAAIRHYCNRVNRLTEQINNLKQRVTALTSVQDIQIQDLKEEREHFEKYFWIMRNRLSNGRTLDQRQLTHMIVGSNDAIKDLELLISKGGRILQLYLMCCKMETEQEKVIPFGYESLSADERFDVELDLKQDSDEALSQEIINFSKMDNFWKRFNCAYLERAALRLHQEALLLENQQLQGAVRHYLATISQGNGLQDVQVPLTGARPSTTRTVRKHITLITGEEEKIRQPRPVTCIEACTSIAVRHMLRSKIM